MSHVVATTARREGISPQGLARQHRRSMKDKENWHMESYEHLWRSLRGELLLRPSQSRMCAFGMLSTRRLHIAKSGDGFTNIANSKGTLESVANVHEQCQKLQMRLSSLHPRSGLLVGLKGSKKCKGVNSYTPNEMPTVESQVQVSQVRRHESLRALESSASTLEAACFSVSTA